MSKVLDTKSITYRLRDTKYYEILGVFYEYELQKVKVNGIYQIEDVKWLGTARVREASFFAC